MNVLRCPYGCRGNFATKQDGTTLRIVCGTCWRIFVVDQGPSIPLYGNDSIQAYVPYGNRVYEEDTGRPMTASFSSIEVERTPDIDIPYHPVYVAPRP